MQLFLRSCVTEKSNASAELIVVTIVVVVTVAALLFLVVLFSNKLRYSKWFIRLLSVRKRHSSMNSSHRPLEPDEVEDLPPPRTERELFSIGDHDDIDTRLGAGPDDGYFLDEIYERSAFVDETTNTSIKDLKYPEKARIFQTSYLNHTYIKKVKLYEFDFL